MEESESLRELLQDPKQFQRAIRLYEEYGLTITVKPGRGSVSERVEMSLEGLSEDEREAFSIALTETLLEGMELDNPGLKVSFAPKSISEGALLVLRAKGERFMGLANRFVARVLTTLQEQGGDAG
jgi:hypothetical protein